MTPSEDRPPDRHVRLNGWKEIAAHLGRSVRTAQRWEREYGLPVRRLVSERSETLFAFADELDAWLETASAARARRHGAGDDEPGAGTQQTDADASNGRAEAPTVVAPSAPPNPRVLRFVIVILAAAVLALAAVGLWLEAWRGTVDAGPDAVPAAYSLDVDRLIVTDARGATLWTHRFSAPVLAPVRYGNLPAGGVEDVDADGRREVWVAVYASPQSDARVGGLYCFESDGRLRWVSRFEGEVRFGSVTYSTPWNPRGLAVTPAPENHAGRAIWAVHNERTYFPSVLQRLDPSTGRPLTTYWSNGYIETLAFTTLAGSPALLVGAASNDHMAASLAVLDPFDPNGSAPASRPAYRCTSCGPGSPQAFVVFPRPARFRSIDETGCVEHIDVSRPGEVVVFTTHAGEDPGAAAVGIYHLSPALRPRRVDAANAYLSLYDVLVRQGTIPPHTPAQVNPAREFLPILHWQGDRFVEVGLETPARVP